jgi:hypothetical protein
MKKSILIIASAMISAVSFAQTVTPKKDSVYKADPARVYQVSLTADQLIALVQTSQHGLVPYLKLSMDKLDNAHHYFNGIVASISDQYRKQYVADSLKAVKPLISSTKKVVKKE